MARKSRKQTKPEPIEARPAARTYNAGAYIRLSAVDKKQKGDSIENQQAIITAYCDEHPGLDISGFYIDNGLSGQTFERPAFQKMLADMEDGVLDCCISKDLSRYGRSAIDMGYYIEKYFPARGIRCIAINDNYDSADGKSEGIMVSLKNLVNESYAHEIGRKIHATKQMNIRNGCFVGSLPPYGYLKSSENKHKLVPDPTAAPIVTRIFEMAANGDSVPAIRDWLNNNTILTPIKHLRSIGAASKKQAEGHNHWNVSVVYTILKNRIYVGDMIQGKSRTQSYNTKRIDKSGWVITQNTHEGLVGCELFDGIQKLFNRQGERAKPNPADNVFFRKIYCGHCGFTMNRTKSGKNSIIYRCGTRQRYSKNDCVANSVNEAVLKGIILESLRKKAAVYCKDSAAHKTEPAKEPSELSGVRAELLRVTGFQKGLYESLLNSDITQKEYADLKQSYEARIADLTKHEKVLTETARDHRLKQIAIDKVSSKLGEISINTELTAPIVDALIKKVLIFEDRRIEVHFKFTDEISVEWGAVDG